MGIISAIRDLFGIGKDQVEKKKLELELKALKEDARSRESMIQEVDLEDVKKYDTKTSRLISKIGKIGVLYTLKQYTILSPLSILVVFLFWMLMLLVALYLFW